MKRLKILLIFCIFQLIFTLPLYSYEYKTSYKDIRVFFNRPPSDDGIEDVIVKLIDSAKKNISGAFFEVGRRRIVEAFIRAAKRLGSENVRIVSHRKYVLGRKLSEFYDDLEACGIVVEYDGKRSGTPGRGLMHNKFMIIDGEYVWTGSMNITTSNMENDYNNSILIKSKDLASIYLKEFDEMFEDGRFGKRKFDDTKKNVVVDGVPIQIYFSPSDGVNDKIVEYIDRAQKSVDFAIFTFTSKKIYQAILRARNRGCTVKGYFDDMSGRSRYSVYKRMYERNFDIKMDHSKRIVHHKFMVLDGKTPNAVLITGSHNFTKGADTKNDENTLFIKSPELAKIYLKELDYLYNGIDPENISKNKIDKSSENKSIDKKEELRKKKLELDKINLQLTNKKLRLLKEKLANQKKREKRKKKFLKSNKIIHERRKNIVKNMDSSKKLLKELIIDVGNKADKEFKDYREIKKKYDKLHFYNFSKKEDLMYSMKRCYNRYDTQRRIYNDLVSMYDNYSGKKDMAQKYKKLSHSLDIEKLKIRKYINSKDKEKEKKVNQEINRLEIYMGYLIKIFDKLNLDISGEKWND